MSGFTTTVYVDGVSL